MDIPQVIEMREIMHGSGAKGRALYVYANAEYGVYQRALRETRRHPFVETFELAALPGQVFKNFADLCAAAKAVTPEMVESERAKWPRLVSLEPVDPATAYQNRCRLCPFVARADLSHKVQNAAMWEGKVAIDGTGFSDWFFGVCDEHKPLTRDPPALLRALQADVEARKAQGREALESMRQRPADPTDNLPF